MSSQGDVYLRDRAGDMDIILYGGPSAVRRGWILKENMPIFRKGHNLISVWCTDTPFFVCFTLLHFTDVAFLQIEEQTFHQQKDKDPLYCDTCFIVMVWNHTHDISEGRLH